MSLRDRTPLPSSLPSVDLDDDFDFGGPGGGATFDLMDDWSLQHRALYGLVRGVGFGFLAGGLEAAVLASTLKLPMSFVDFVLMGLVGIVVMGAAAFVAGLPGVVAYWVGKSWRTSRAISLHLAFTALILVGFYLWQIALGVAAEGRMVAAAAMAAMPFGFAGVVFFNAAYWLRKTELGVRYPLGWLPISGLGAVGFVLLSAGLYQGRDTGGSYALAGDANVVVVTVDGLRHDHVGTFGGGDLTPSLDGIAREGVAYLDTVSPVAASRGAHATAFTGLHPLRHKTVFVGDVLERKYRTLAETLEKEGYATGAFLSSYELDASAGLSQGFRIYDDDFSPLPGVLRLRLPALVAAFLPLPPRSGGVTVDRFGRWLQGKKTVPFFAWVHFTIDSQDRQRYGVEVSAVDGWIGDVAAELETAGVADDTVLVVLGTHGRSFGDRGPGGLWDELVRVPLVVRSSRLKHLKTRRVEPQVRLMDVTPTILELLELESPAEMEGVELLGYPRGLRKATMWCALVGTRGDASSPLIGMRNNGVKYVRDAASGAERLHDLRDDPSEATNLVGDQPTTLAQARRLIAMEAVALRKLTGIEEGELSDDQRGELRALGYQW